MMTTLLPLAVFAVSRAQGQGVPAVDIASYDVIGKTEKTVRMGSRFDPGRVA